MHLMSGIVCRAAVFSSDVSFAGAAAKVHQMCKTADEDLGWLPHDFEKRLRHDSDTASDYGRVGTKQVYKNAQQQPFPFKSRLIYLQLLTLRPGC
jgi:hypothetical protein